MNNIRNLKAYSLSYELVMKMFCLTKKFPKEERYSLVEQIGRSLRAVSVNIREGFTKRKYKKIFNCLST